MSAVEALLEAEFKPARTVLLSFGFDEEVSGPEGAGHLAPFITERYGEDSVAVIVDEGSTFSTVWGQVFALPGYVHTLTRDECIKMLTYFSKVLLRKGR